MIQVDPQASLAPVDVRRMFQRVLVAWARDALALRRTGLDRPSARGTTKAWAIAPGRVEPSRETHEQAPDSIHGRMDRAPRAR